MQFCNCIAWTCRFCGLMMQRCTSSFLCQASKPWTFPRAGLFSFGDIWCHFQRPCYSEVPLVFPNASARYSVIRKRALLSITWKYIHSCLWIKPLFEEKNKKTFDGIKSVLYQESQVLKVSLEVDINSEYLSQALTGDIWKVQFSLLLPMSTSYKLHQKHTDSNSSENWASTRLWRAVVMGPRAPFQIRFNNDS